jgi:hypothetical protein
MTDLLLDDLLADVRVVRSMLTPDLCEVASAYLRLKAEIGEMALGDSQLPHSYSSYGDTLMEVLLDRLQPTVEATLGEAMLPTHSYARLYRHGDELTPHTDRIACEVVLSLTLGCHPELVWPLFVGPGEDAHPVDLAPGDGLIYPGSTVEHWRRPFPGEWQAQLTLHYVRRDGRFADEVFDRRPGLGRHVGTRRVSGLRR